MADPALLVLFLEGTSVLCCVGVRLGAGTTTVPALRLTGLISSARGGPDRMVGDAVDRPVTGWLGLKSWARGGAACSVEATCACWLSDVRVVDVAPLEFRASWPSLSAAPAGTDTGAGVGAGAGDVIMICWSGLHVLPLPRGCAGMIVTGKGASGLRLAVRSRSLPPASFVNAPKRFLRSQLVKVDAGVVALGASVAAARALCTSCGGEVRFLLNGLGTESHRDCSRCLFLLTSSSSSSMMSFSFRSSPPDLRCCVPDFRGWFRRLIGCGTSATG